MRCCLPVKNGWQFEQTSTCSSGLIDTVWNVLPQAQTTFAWTYLGWIFSFIGTLPLTLWDDADATAVVAGGRVGDRPRDEREQRVVLACPDVLAGQDAGPALAHDHCAGVDDRPAVLLHAEPLPGGVATVAGRARTLLMC